MSEWALALLALAVLGFAAVSGRLAGTPITPAMVFVAFGLLVGREGIDGIDLSSTGSVVRTLAEATLALVLFCDASRIDLGQLRRGFDVPVRLLAIGLPLTIFFGHRGCGCPLRRAERRRGVDPRDHPGADGCRAGTGGGHRAACAAADPSGTQRRERAQRRDLRAAVARGRRGCRRRVRDLRRPPSRHVAARGDRLRRAGRSRRRAGDRRHPHPGGPARPDRPRVEAGDPGCRCRPRLRNRDRTARVRLHRGLRGRHRVPPGAPARPRGSQRTQRGGRRRPQRDHLRTLRRHPARTRPDRH